MTISRFFDRRPPAKSKGPQLLTPRVKATEVRLIDGENHDVVSREEAELRAEETGLDLVIVSLDSSPPVVRLVDYGKYKFEAEKKAKEAKKKQTTIDTKEVKMGIRIDDHDYNVKVNHAIKFLKAGNKVKFTIRLKGRETQHAELAFDLANRFIVDLTDFSTQDGPVRKEGRNLNLLLSPRADMPTEEATAKSDNDVSEEPDVSKEGTETNAEDENT